MVNLIEKIYAVQTGVEIPNAGTTNHTYTTYVAAIYKFAVIIGTSLAVLMIVYASIKYITAAGNQTATNDAKDIILNAILGFVILLLISFILNALGVPRPW